MVIIRWAGRPKWWSGKVWGRKDDAVEYSTQYAKMIIKKRWGLGIKDGVSHDGKWYREVVGEAVVEAI